MLHLNREVVISAVGDTTTLTLLKNSSNITSLADNNSTLNASDIAGTGIINYTADIAGDGGVWGNELSELR